MTMNWILLNIPLGALMVGFTVGLPLWVMLKHPDGDDPAKALTQAPLGHVAGTVATTGSATGSVATRRAA
jgi:hypothetical protein